MISPPCRKNDVVNQILYDLRWLDIRPLSAPDTCIISEAGKKVINYFSKYYKTILKTILKPFYKNSSFPFQFPQNCFVMYGGQDTFRQILKAQADAAGIDTGWQPKNSPFCISLSIRSCTWFSVSFISPVMLTEPGEICRNRSIYYASAKDSLALPICFDNSVVLNFLSPCIISR